MPLSAGAFLRRTCAPAIAALCQWPPAPDSCRGSLWLFSCLFRGSQLQRYNLGVEDLESAIAAYLADAQLLDVCAEKLRVPLRLCACVCALVRVRDYVRVGVATSCV